MFLQPVNRCIHCTNRYWWFHYVFDVKVVQQRKTFARLTCVTTEECASASGTPTAATARSATEARIVNKVRRRQSQKCLCVCLCIYIFIYRCVYLYLHAPLWASQRIHAWCVTYSKCVSRGLLGNAVCLGDQNGIKSASPDSVWLMQQPQWRVTVKPLLADTQTLNIASGLELKDKNELWLTYQNPDKRMKQNTLTPIAIALCCQLMLCYHVVKTYIQLL